jgi:hypothetical protein
LVFIPCIIFALSSIFALILWTIECDASTSDTRQTGVCDWYQWFLYVCSNLVGLGNPLTNVSPQSGHVLSEMVDLLVAVWALSVFGTVVGVIGGLSAMRNFDNFLNALILRTERTHEEGADARSAGRCRGRL